TGISLFTERQLCLLRRPLSQAARMSQLPSCHPAPPFDSRRSPSKRFFLFFSASPTRSASRVLAAPLVITPFVLGGTASTAVTTLRLVAHRDVSSWVSWNFLDVA